ncbi:uncharacterized protein N7518_005796 [Penicillium psychrosexuale]|uniref:uncharacterized protein n=1 Tax=Penicillium psychrosexuale TaxID=1002107 RepID=UPI00254597F3|nr:uncharacterized protein N7518_005796 [Penicillium psychrosexuale]KAJ5797256.1 hypothetical protein N7518_005796 [Penicillium psychrosexuale]
MSNNPMWYFAYGSNMLSDVFITRRKIQPLRSEVALVKTQTLCFNIMGVPYTDPAMGGLRPAEEQDIPVYGIAYLLSPDDMRKVIISEGGGIAYKAEVFTATLQNDGSEDLLIRGASEHSLPESYQKRLLSQQTFIPGQSCRFKVGKWLFDGFWQRVAYWIEKGVYKFKDGEGNVPPWFLVIFDFLLWTMWYYHDYVHSVIWGRGDGLNRK